MRLELTRRADYAIRAVIHLARADRADTVPASRIAETMDIPGRFLPQVMRDLSRAGIIEATLGRKGGYRLARDPQGLSLLAVIEAVEGDTRRRVCVLRSLACDPGRPCDVHGVFAEAQDALLGRIADVSVQDLADGPAPPGPRRRRPSAASPDA